MNCQEMMDELKAKTAAIDAERVRRNAALHKALNALRECCRVCPRDGLCSSERCAVWYALKYKPLEGVARLSDRKIKAGRGCIIDDAGTLRPTSRRGRKPSGRVVIDDIKL